MISRDGKSPNVPKKIAQEDLLRLQMSRMNPTEASMEGTTSRPTEARQLPDLPHFARATPV